jgi:hypothetical protein
MCLGSSLDIINSNVSTLSSNLSSMMINVDDWYDVYTSIVGLSSNILSTIFTIKSIKNAFDTTYNTVSSLSGNWAKEFSLVYPEIFDFTTWYAASTASRDSIMQTWLSINFPVDNYLDQQVINVFVNLNQAIYFGFFYSRSYNETCSVTKKSGGLATCTSCPDDRHFQGCNITGHGCSNAWSHCGGIFTGDSQQGVCAGSGAAELNIYSSKICADRYFSRTTLYTYIKDVDTWVATWS